MVLFVFCCAPAIKAKDLTEDDGKEVGEGGRVQKVEMSSSLYTWTPDFRSPDEYLALHALPSCRGPLSP